MAGGYPADWITTAKGRLRPLLVQQRQTDVEGTPPPATHHYGGKANQ